MALLFMAQIQGGDGTGVAASQGGEAGSACMLGQVNWAGELMRPS